MPEFIKIGIKKRSEDVSSLRFLVFRADLVSWHLFTVKGRIVKIDVFSVHFFLAKTNTFTKSLEMDNFTLTKKTNDIGYVRVITEPKNIVIG